MIDLNKNRPAKHRFFSVANQLKYADYEGWLLQEQAKLNDLVKKKLSSFKKK